MIKQESHKLEIVCLERDSCSHSSQSSIYITKSYHVTWIANVKSLHFFFTIEHITIKA